MTAKEKLHKRVDGLSEEQANVADLLLVDENLDDPMLQALANAPEDDEPWTEEDEAAVQEARDELARGEPTISHEEIKREFGIE
jgi:hypothetical protein